MSENKPVQLGLCCLNLHLRAKKPSVYASRRIMIKTIQNKGISELKARILANLQDTLTMIEWNESHGIKVLRLSSELFPHKSNPKVDDYDYDFAMPLLKQIGNLAKKYNHRLTFHPGQYDVVGTTSKKIFQQTCLDLKYHADILDMMELDNNSVIVVHGGGIYGNKTNTMQRWCQQFYQLPDNVQQRLVIENCERCFSINDCLLVSSQIGIPVVFDTHHFECYQKIHSSETFELPETYIPRILDTWKIRSIKPKFHISQQGEGKIGHHSDFITEIPEYLLEIPAKYQIEIDIIVEAKMKEQAIFKLYHQYPELNCLIKIEKSGKLEKSLKKNNGLKIPGYGWAKKYLQDCDCCQ